MAFFDEMKSRVTQAGQSAAKSAKEFSETARLNSEISDAENRINQLYNQIGYKVYCAYSAHPLQEAADEIEQVNALHDKIENCRLQIQAINAASRCPNCGAKIRPGMAFCSGCGARLVQEQPQPAAQAFCSGCGAPLAPGAAFCTSCGARVEQPAAPAPAPAQAAPVRVTVPAQPAQPVQAAPAAPAEVCPSCGAPLAAGAVFCVNCGTSLQPAAQPAPAQPAQAAVCPGCGEPIPADATFCINCGTKLN